MYPHIRCKQTEALTLASSVVIGRLMIAFHKLMVGARLCKLMNRWEMLVLHTEGGVRGLLYTYTLRIHGVYWKV